jgi:hypothetical protein
MLMILEWFFALGSLDFDNSFYENMYTYMFQPYNSFRIKCNAVNDFRKAGFNFQNEKSAMNFDILLKTTIEQTEKGLKEMEEETEGTESDPRVLPEELTKIKELFTKHSFSNWALEDDFGYAYRDCITKELKDCTYPYWDMWWLSAGMGLLYVAGIASVIFNLPMIGKILKKFPITAVVSTVLQSIGLLTYEPDLPFFAVFIVVMVSIYWGAVANRYKEDCQSVIDSKEEWYDNVPAYAVGGSVSLMLVQTALAERRKSQVRELLKNRIQELKKKKEMSEKEKWKNFMSAGSGSRLDKFVNKFGGGQRLDQKREMEKITSVSNSIKKVIKKK